MVSCGSHCSDARLVTVKALLSMKWRPQESTEGLGRGHEGFLSSILRENKSPSAGFDPEGCTYRW